MLAPRKRSAPKDPWERSSTEHTLLVSISVTVTDKFRRSGAEELFASSLWPMLSASLKKERSSSSRSI